MNEDPIVNEVRTLRAEYAERFDFDLQAIYQDLKAQEEVSERNIVILPPRQLIKPLQRAG